MDSIVTLANIPADISQYIADLVSIGAALNLCIVTPNHEFCHDEEFWKRLVTRSFPGLYLGDNWKSVATKLAPYDAADISQQLVIAFGHDDTYMKNYLLSRLSPSEQLQYLANAVRLAIDSGNVNAIISILEYMAHNCDQFIHPGTGVLLDAQELDDKILCINFGRYAAEYAISINAVDEILIAVANNVTDDNIYDIVNYAIDLGNIAAVKYFLLETTYISEREFNMLFVKAVASGNIDIIDYFLELGAVNSDVAISAAINKNNLPLIRYLLERDPIATINAPFMYAIYGRKYDIARLLTQYGADDWFHAVTSAIHKNDLEVVKEYIDRYLATVGDRERALNMLLLQSIPTHNIKMVQYLLSLGATDVNGALRRAASEGDIELMKYFLSLGADEVNDALLDAIAVKGSDQQLQKVVQFLVDHGADNYDDAIVLAIQNKRNNLVDYFMTLGAGSDKGTLLKLLSIANAYKNSEMRAKIVKLLRENFQ